MSGMHSHSHGNNSDHAQQDYGTAFKVGILLNVGFVLVEASYGFIANSTALIADAGHNMSDVLGLAMAWAAAFLGRSSPTSRFTYGLGATSILSALGNVMLLLLAVGGIAWEALRRFWEPASVSGSTVMVVAAIGVIINGITAYLFASGSKGDLNIRGAFIHMLADTGVSAGVVIAGLLILQTGWTWIDPVVSLLIGAVILIGTWSLLKGSVLLSLNAVPDDVDMERVSAWLQRLPGVAEVHDLHVWAISTSETALTAHLLMPDGGAGDEFFADVQAALSQEFKINHPTLQIETGSQTCRFASRDVV